MHSFATSKKATVASSSTHGSTPGVLQRQRQPNCCSRHCISTMSDSDTDSDWPGNHDLELWRPVVGQHSFEVESQTDFVSVHPHPATPPPSPPTSQAPLVAPPPPLKSPGPQLPWPHHRPIYVAMTCKMLRKTCAECAMSSKMWKKRHHAYVECVPQ